VFDELQKCVASARNRSQDRETHSTVTMPTELLWPEVDRLPYVQRCFSWNFGAPCRNEGNWSSRTLRHTVTYVYVK
jgi:hypothetical protein